MAEQSPLTEVVFATVRESVRESTQRQYFGAISRWFDFCDSKNAPLAPSFDLLVEFLNVRQQEGVAYSSLLTAKAAVLFLADLWGDTALKSAPLWPRVMRGLWNRKPSLKPSGFVWDPALVLDHISRQPTIESLTVAVCGRYAATLFALATACRAQTMAVIRREDVKHLEDGSMVITIPFPLKQSRPNFHTSQLRVLQYADTRVCPVAFLRAYMAKTEGSNGLFVNCRDSSRPVVAQTIAQWIKRVLTDSGVRGFTAHSTRKAATSAAALAGVPLEKILSQAGWTSVSTFARFYERPILSDISMFHSLTRTTTERGQHAPASASPTPLPATSDLMH